MKSKKYNIPAKLFLSALLYLLSLTLPHLKAQDTIQLWQRISEGKFDITNNYQVGKYVVMTTVLDKGSKPAIVAGKNSFQPLSVWDLELDTFVALTNNWTGAPMNPIRLFKYDSSRVFITDGVKIIRADIDFENKFIQYEQTFQGNRDSNFVNVFYRGKSDIYFCSTFPRNYVFVCDTLGNIQKTIHINGPNWIEWITSIVEWKDTIYFGYTYNGGLADGSGLATLDPATGQITKLRHPEWMNNSEGCTISVIDGAFYLVTDAAKYKFQRSLFRYQNGDWVPIVIRCGFPETKNGKTIIGIGKDGHYPNGDTINKNSTGFNYEFTNGVIGKLVPSDPRLDIQFSEEFKTEYWQRHGNMPYIDFIYEIGNKTIGFGANIVAELVNINTSAVKSIELAKLSVYPNPAKSTIHISGLNNAVDYEVYNLLGSRMLHGSTLNAINVSSLPSGLFLLKTPLGCAKVLKE